MTTRTQHRYRRPIVAAAAAVVLVAALALGACAHDERTNPNRPADRAVTIERRQAASTDPKRETAAKPQVQIEVPEGARVERSTRAQLATAAQQFALTLVRWLYGDRREIDVEPIGAEAQRQLTNTPPYVPTNQIGSEDAQAIGVRAFLQTPRSGLLVVAIRDPRTTYSIPASFERRAGRWLIVHLSTD